MFANLFILLVLLVLAIGAGWLTFKAVRARKLWVKLLGGLFAGLLTLILAALVFLGGKGFIMGYFPKVSPAPELTVAGTPEQIARGEYLANLSCVTCHGSFPDGPEGDSQMPLAGGADIAAMENIGFLGRFSAENLTPGGKLANYTDGEIFRALRHGVDQDGKRLGFMSLIAVGDTSDEDIEALIAYMRAQPAVPSPAPTGDQVSFVGLLFMGGGLLPAPAVRPDNIPAVEPGLTPEYGKYMASLGDCRGCHGSDMTGMPESPTGPAVPNPRPAVSGWTQEEFIQTMKTGIRPDGNPFAERMPWEIASRMTDQDLAALYVYLTSPVASGN